MLNKVYLFILFLSFFAGSQSWAQKQTSPAVPKGRCRVNFPSDSRIEWYCYGVKSEKALEDLLGQYLEPVLRFNRIDRVHALQGAYIKIPVNLRDVVGFTPMPQKLEWAKGYRRYLLLDRSEQFLGAYEFGELKFSLPIASGRRNSMPAGVFKILGRDRWHRSSLYLIEPAGVPYPMYWGIKFYVSKKGTAFWIHSRDMPGYPVSHGCVGVYDEEMQKKFHGFPKNPQLLDARKLFLWLFPGGENDTKPLEYPGGLPDALVEIK